jgi:hypothetical protein
MFHLISTHMTIMFSLLWVIGLLLLGVGWWSLLSGLNSKLTNGFENLGRNQVSMAKATNHRHNMMDDKLWEIQQLINPTVMPEGERPLTQAEASYATLRLANDDLKQEIVTLRKRNARLISDHAYQLSDLVNRHDEETIINRTVDIPTTVDGVTDVR